MQLTIRNKQDRLNRQASQQKPKYLKRERRGGCHRESSLCGAVDKRRKYSKGSRKLLMTKKALPFKLMKNSAGKGFLSCYGAQR